MIHMQPFTPISDEASSSGCQRLSAGGRRRSARLSFKSGSFNECHSDENLEQTDSNRQSCSKHMRRLSGKSNGRGIDPCGDPEAIKSIASQKCK